LANSNQFLMGMFQFLPTQSYGSNCAEIRESSRVQPSLNLSITIQGAPGVVG